MDNHYIMQDLSNSRLTMLEGHLALIFKCIEDNNCGYTDFAFLPILKTCFDLTSDYDESHNLRHHVSVLTNALEIFSYEYLHGGQVAEPRNLGLGCCPTSQAQVNPARGELKRLRKIIIYASLLHDTIDHKYPTNLEDKNFVLQDFLQEKLGDEWLDVKWVIDNISYTKEVKNGYPQHSDPIVQIARDIVSDADKLEAIGLTGIIRCQQFNKANNPSTSEENIVQIVVEHCNEKLLKLKDNFIKTNHGKLMAVPLHQMIADYVDLDTKN